MSSSFLCMALKISHFQFSSNLNIQGIMCIGESVALMARVMLCYLCLGKSRFILMEQLHNMKHCLWITMELSTV